MLSQGDSNYNVTVLARFQSLLLTLGVTNTKVSSLIIHQIDSLNSLFQQVIHQQLLTIILL